MQNSKSSEVNRSKALSVLNSPAANDVKRLFGEIRRSPRKMKAAALAGVAAVTLVAAGQFNDGISKAVREQAIQSIDTVDGKLAVMPGTHLRYTPETVDKDDQLGGLSNVETTATKEIIVDQPLASTQYPGWDAFKLPAKNSSTADIPVFENSGLASNGSPEFFGTNTLNVKEVNKPITPENTVWIDVQNLLLQGKVEYLSGEPTDYGEASVSSSGHVKLTLLNNKTVPDPLAGYSYVVPSPQKNHS